MWATGTVLGCGWDDGLASRSLCPPHYVDVVYVREREHQRDEVRSPSQRVLYVASLSLTSVLLSSEIADACARDINHLFCNVASASIRGINCLSLSCKEPGEKVRRISSIASAITCPDHGTGGQKACLHLVISSSPAHASCSTRGVSPSFDPHLP